jgi:hypothetical protein
MDTAEFNELILGRYRECGIGLCGQAGAIARWMFKEHNVVVSTRYVSELIETDRKERYGATLRECNKR